MDGLTVATDYATLASVVAVVVVAVHWIRNALMTWLGGREHD